MKNKTIAVFIKNKIKIFVTFKYIKYLEPKMRLSMLMMNPN